MKLNAEQRAAARRQLGRLYASTSSDVAFIDESYRLPSTGFGDPFYLMTAVVVSVNDLDSLRDGLIDVAGGNRWHTTETFGLGTHGRMAIEDMTRVVTAGGGISLVTVHARPVDDDRNLEKARQSCFGRLSHLLTRGTPDTAVRVIVYEGRREGEELDRDAATIQWMDRQGIVPSDTRFFATSSSAEPLLWAPDVASWALRFQLTRDDDRYWSHLAPVSRVVSARTGNTLDPAMLRQAGALGQIKREDIQHVLRREAPRPPLPGPASTGPELGS